MSKTKQNISDILNSQEKLAEFAELNRLTVEMAKKILEQLFATPELDERVTEFIFSNKTSDELKAHHVAQEIGFKKGHEVGFAKGVAATLASLTVAGVLLILKNK